MTPWPKAHCIMCGREVVLTPELAKQLESGEIKWVAHRGEFVELAARRNHTRDEIRGDIYQPNNRINSTVK